MQLPVGDDMTGRPLEGFIARDFLARHPLERVPTHDTPEWREAQRRLPVGDLGRDERIEQLRALGYLE